jgi:hypothetical protein
LAGDPSTSQEYRYTPRTVPLSQRADRQFAAAAITAQFDGLYDDLAR